MPTYMANAATARTAARTQFFIAKCPSKRLADPRPAPAAGAASIGAGIIATTGGKINRRLVG
jgi:hypothetical protein